MNVASGLLKQAGTSEEGKPATCCGVKRQEHAFIPDNTEKGVRAVDARNASYDNVDPREAARYQALAETWWDSQGPFWPLHRLNRLRTDYLKHVLAGMFNRDAAASQPLEGLNLLDVGCGGGILSESMARLGANVHGIDIVLKNVEIARLHARESGLPVEYAAVHARALRQHGAQYDAVLNMEVVEHIPDPAALVDDCAALLRPGGALVLATINRTWLSWLFAIAGAEYILRWLPQGTHRWDRFIKPEELATYAEQCGLQLTAKTGVRINPINRHFSLTRQMAVNYMLVAQKKAEPPTGREGIWARAKQRLQPDIPHNR
jgi:2-polyprenyl-6-hydroxyphenyl methylase/3-demethylubiquinone-9 3-methyltransferase